ncbi:MAG: TRAP transporter small permease [Treponema sp.]|jgi:TRAP-type C4-dicarboxylate transport system permease small subunit|nr:TRAP transporter small permease [Treponema sp.]
MNNKPVDILKNLDVLIAGSALSALIVVTFLGVGMRYFIGRPIIWGEEFQLVCIIVVVFFGAGAGFRFGSHVAIDIVVERFPQGVQKAAEVIIYLISVIILGYFTLQSARLVQQMYTTERTTDILDIPYCFIYAAFPIGCVLMIINYSVSVYKKLQNRREGA